MENKLNLTRQVILATRNATLAYHNYMYTDREYVKGHKLYLREMHFLLFVGISKELTMSEIAEKMNITQGAATVRKTYCPIRLSFPDLIRKHGESP